MRLYQLIKVSSNYDFDDNILCQDSECLGIYKTREQVLEEVKKQRNLYKSQIIDNYIDPDCCEDETDYKSQKKYISKLIDSVTTINKKFKESSTEFNTVMEINYDIEDDENICGDRLDTIELRVLILEPEDLIAKGAQII